MEPELYPESDTKVIWADQRGEPTFTAGFRQEKDLIFSSIKDKEIHQF